MTVSVTHQFVSAIADDAAAVAAGEVVPSNWNATHTITGLAASATTDTTTTANITDSTNKRFITDAQQTVLGNTSGTNTGDQIVPANTTATGSNWFSAYTSATGVFTKSQPATTDLSDILTFSLNTSGSITTSNAPALSASAFTGSGALRTGGTGTTTFPYHYINQGTAPTTWGTNGTLIGLNSPSGFTGNYLDFHLNGGTSVFLVSSGGGITNSGGVSAQGSVSSATSLVANTSSVPIRWSSSTKMLAPSDGILELLNSAGNGFTRLQMGGTTSSFPAIKVNGANINFRLADDSADTGITSSTLAQSGKTTTYNNIVTTGWGHPAVYGSGRSTAQTAAVASVATYTVGAADGSFIISSNVLVTASTTHSITVTCAYTDEGNTARTLTLNFSQITGTFLTAITNVQGVGAYEGIPLHIRCLAATAITIATTGTFTSITYNVEGHITQIG